MRTFKLLRAASRWRGCLRASRRALERRVARRGSEDYRAASGALRASMVRLVNADLRPQLAQLSPSTLIIWGELDSETPLGDARLMERLIPDAGLVVFEGSGHFAYAEQPDRFCPRRRRLPPWCAAMNGIIKVALVAVAGAAWLALFARVVLVAARMYQIEEYEARRLLGWGGASAWLLHRRSLVAAAPVAAVTVFALAVSERAGLRPALVGAWLAGRAWRVMLCGVAAAQEGAGAHRADAPAAGDDGVPRHPSRRARVPGAPAGAVVARGGGSHVVAARR